MDSDEATAIAPETPAEAPYFTVHECTACGAEVHGLHGRWTCPTCGECSPYSEPPEGWQSEIGYRDMPQSPPRPHRRR